MIRINVLGEEEDTSNLCQVRRDPGSFVSQTSHGAAIWNMHPLDEVDRQRRGRNDYLCGVLPQSATVGEMPGAGLPGGIT